jgi:hypothetical protein
MRKWLILGFLGLVLPAMAWGQDAGEAYMGQKIQEEQAPPAERGPLSVPYPPDPYPPRAEGPPMTEGGLQAYQANLGESREKEPAQEEVKKETIEPSPQERQE